MPERPKHAYLFLLERPSIDGRRTAAERLRELGMRVIAQFGSVAIEAEATEDQAAAAHDLGIFSAQLKGPMAREHLQKLNDEQRQVIGVWNTRFAPAYRKLTKDLTHAGKPWDAEGLAPPLGYSPIDPEDFRQLVSDYEKRSGERIVDAGDANQTGRRKGGRSPKPMNPEEFVEFERRLVTTYEDETLGYHLARLGFRLEPAWRDVLLRLPKGLIAELLERFFAEAACWEMTGEMSVGIVFVESSQSGGPRFTATERSQVCQEILDGLSWLTSQHPGGNLSWVYDFQFITIDVANGSGDPDEAYWRDPAMGELSYDGNTYSAAWSSVAEYREDMRDANRSAHAFVVFATPYANSWHAYAGSSRITLANKNDWGGWGRATLDAITAHEASHLFGAADEYTGSGTPCSSCSTIHGCDNIPNGNCGACATPRQACVMDGNSRRLCNYSRGHIGWSTLFVETTTADVLWAGTDDTVWVDIGDRAFELDTADHDDRERNNTEGYAIWAPDVRRQDVKRILIRKSPDGFAGGWRLEHVRAWHQGQLICDSAVNRWLEDDQRVWTGCIADRDLVSRLRVKITTADVTWAGTDDDVTLTLAGRSWDLDNPDRDDFERGRTDTFDLDPDIGLYRSAIASVRIHKSPDGIAGGWRLKGVELIVNGSTIYTNQSINRWLEDDHRTWSASI
ncbi:MAG: PLAT/LH2 domain-containing protein [Candidatus Limnocylindria bacterium]